MKEINDPRREFLIKALSSGLFVTSAAGLSVPAWAKGRIPDELPPGRSIYKLNGDVNVDNKPANIDTTVTPNSVVETGRNGTIIFAVGKDAFILRSNSKLEMTGKNLLLSGLRLVTGKLLSVFGHRKQNENLRMGTTVATIGIRGTGVYLEADPEQTYVCTCYGTTDIASATDKQSSETIITEYHDTPRIVLANAPVGKKIRTAPVINHTDEELELIESLVGRSVPFAASGEYE
jgi:hypothetical protein